MFLQTGLGLARNQWDQNFGAFDPYGYQLRRVANLPWMDWQPGGPGDYTFSSQEIPKELWSRWEVVPNDQKAKHRGYFPGLDCYYWGFRPPDEQVVLLGVHGTFGLGKGLGDLPSPFKICMHQRPDRTCSTPAPCPTPVPCPPTPDCPPCAAMPTVAPSKYGVNVGLIVAASLTAGVGYYGYKKGWFKRRA